MDVEIVLFLVEGMIGLLYSHTFLYLTTSLIYFSVLLNMSRSFKKLILNPDDSDEQKGAAIIKFFENERAKVKKGLEEFEDHWNKVFNYLVARKIGEGVEVNNIPDFPGLTPDVEMYRKKVPGKGKKFTTIAVIPEDETEADRGEVEKMIAILEGETEPANSEDETEPSNLELQNMPLKPDVMTKAVEPQVVNEPVTPEVRNKTAKSEIEAEPAERDISTSAKVGSTNAVTTTADLQSAPKYDLSADDEGDIIASHEKMNIESNGRKAAVSNFKDLMHLSIPIAKEGENSVEREKGSSDEAKQKQAENSDQKRN